MEKINNKAIGRTWEEFEKEIYTPEEIAESNARVAKHLEWIDAGKPPKVYRDKDGKVVIIDTDILDLYEIDGVVIDPGTGTPIIPGKLEECFGNGRYDDFECCCDNCDHFLKCFPVKGGEKNDIQR